VDEKLTATWSPEQILNPYLDSGYLKAKQQPAVSHEAIYQHIYADKHAGGTLDRALWGQNIHRKRHTGRERRGVIPNQVSIDQRPPIVVERGRFDAWEVDLILRAGDQQALVTLNERTSRCSLIAHIPAKTAQNGSDAMAFLRTPFKHCTHTLTTDNGKEFAQHEWIAARLDADFFFANPYASWERGANENMNSLIREFFPKKMRFNTITEKDVSLAMHRLNHRPRKYLGFRTPHEIFMESYTRRIMSLHFRVESA